MNVLLNYCKQNTTSLSLLVGTTVANSHALCTSSALVASSMLVKTLEPTAIVMASGGIEQTKGKLLIRSCSLYYRYMLKKKVSDTRRRVQ